MANPHYVQFDYRVVADGVPGNHSVKTRMLVYGSHCLVHVPSRDDYRLALMEHMEQMGWSFKTTVEGKRAFPEDLDSPRWMFRKERT